MSFAAPAFLTLALLAVPVIGLFLLRVRLRRIPVATSMFWQQVHREHPPRSPGRRLRHLMSLLVQLAILLLLVLAAADPVRTSGNRTPLRTVLVLDNSAGMQATDLQPSRLEAARAEARQLIEHLQPGDEIAILAATQPPTVVIGLTNHRSSLSAALESVRAADGPTRLQPAVELARTLLAGHPRGRVLVLTDGCVDDTDLSALSLDTHPSATGADSAPAETRHVLEWRQFGSAASNVGITQFQARRSWNDPLSYELLIGVQNASAEHVECRLELLRDQTPVDILPLRLRPDEQWTQSLAKTSVDGGRLEARLLDFAAVTESEPAGTASRTVFRDHLAADNTAYAVLPGRARQRVLLISPGNVFLQKVFEAQPLVDLTIRTTLPEVFPEDTLIVLHQLVPPVLPSQPLLVIDPAVSSSLWTVGPLLNNPIAAEWDEQSPLMTFVRLDQVVMPSARRLTFAAPVRVLAETPDGDPLYVQWGRSPVPGLLLNVNLEQSDLTFRTTFPILIGNAMNWFAGDPGDQPSAYSAGEVATIPVADSPPGLTWRLLDPDGTPNSRISVVSGTEQVASAASQGMWLIAGPLDRAGLWTIRPSQTADGPVLQSVASERQPASALAVNVASRRESDLRPAAGIAASGTVVPVSSGGRPVWPFLIVAACILSGVEWILSQRRILE